MHSQRLGEVGLLITIWNASILGDKTAGKPQSIEKCAVFRQGLAVYFVKPRTASEGGDATRCKFLRILEFSLPLLNPTFNFIGMNFSYKIFQDAKWVLLYEVDNFCQWSLHSNAMQYVFMSSRARLTFCFSLR